VALCHLIDLPLSTRQHLGLKVEVNVTFSVGYWHATVVPKASKSTIRVRIRWCLRLQGGLLYQHRLWNPTPIKWVRVGVRIGVMIGVEIRISVRVRTGLGFKFRVRIRAYEAGFRVRARVVNGSLRSLFS